MPPVTANSRSAAARRALQVALCAALISVVAVYSAGHHSGTTLNVTGSPPATVGETVGAAFDHAREHGMFCTCHAGEGAGPESVAEAAKELA